MHGGPDGSSEARLDAACSGDWISKDVAEILGESPVATLETDASACPQGRNVEKESQEEEPDQVAPVEAEADPVAQYLHEYCYAAASSSTWRVPPGPNGAQRRGPVLEIQVAGHKEMHGFTVYDVECVLRLESVGKHFWQVGRRLKEFQDLHRRVKTALGGSYTWHFFDAHFPCRGGLPGTTSKLTSWCAALAACINVGRCPPDLVANVLQTLECPKGLFSGKLPKTCSVSLQLDDHIGVGVREFRLCLHRDEGSSWGMRVGERSSTLEVLKVNEGALTAEWNAAHPDRAVRVGDFIVEVNGIRENVVEMFKALKASRRIDILVRNGLVRHSAAVLFDLYQVESAKVSGGFGSVRRCTQKSTGISYAIKSVKLTDDEHFDNLRHEYSLIRRVNHPNIVCFKEAFTDSDGMHLVMECLTGGDLAEFTQSFMLSKDGKIAKKECTPVVPIDVCDSFTAQIIDGIAYLHEHRVCHRDIKPGNYMLKDTRSKCKVLKLIDFGLACIFDKDELKDLSCGTLPFIAPEVLDGRYNEKCDIWSAGATVFVMLVGSDPFAGRGEVAEANIRARKLNVADLRWSQVVSHLREFVETTLRTDALERPSAQSLLRDLPWLRTADRPAEERALRCIGDSWTRGKI